MVFPQLQASHTPTSIRRLRLVILPSASPDGVQQQQQMQLTPSNLFTLELRSVDGTFRRLARRGTYERRTGPCAVGSPTSLARGCRRQQRGTELSLS